MDQVFGIVQVILLQTGLQRGPVIIHFRLPIYHQPKSWPVVLVQFLLIP